MSLRDLYSEWHTGVFKQILRFKNAYIKLKKKKTCLLEWIISWIQCLATYSILKSRLQASLIDKKLNKSMTLASQLLVDNNE